MSEIWKPIPDFVGKYEVSDLGRVRAIHPIQRKGPRRQGSRRTYGPNNMLNQWKGPKGMTVFLCDDNDKWWQRLVHTLVLRVFVGPQPDPSFLCHHIDGNKCNNRLENLSWKQRHKSLKPKSKPRKRPYSPVSSYSVAKRIGIPFHTLIGWINKGFLSPKIEQIKPGGFRSGYKNRHVWTEEQIKEAEIVAALRRLGIEYGSVVEYITLLRKEPDRLNNGAYLAVIDKGKGKHPEVKVIDHAEVCSVLDTGKVLHLVNFGKPGERLPAYERERMTA